MVDVSFNSNSTKKSGPGICQTIPKSALRNGIKGSNPNRRDKGRISLQGITGFTRCLHGNFRHHGGMIQKNIGKDFKRNELQLLRDQYPVKPPGIRATGLDCLTPAGRHAGRYALPVPRQSNHWITPAGKRLAEFTISTSAICINRACSMCIITLWLWHHLLDW